MPKTEADQTRPITFEDINGQLLQQHRSTAYGTIHGHAGLPYVHSCLVCDLFEAGHCGRDAIVLSEEKRLEYTALQCATVSLSCDPHL